MRIGRQVRKRKLGVQGQDRRSYFSWLGLGLLNTALSVDASLRVILDIQFLALLH